MSPRREPPSLVPPGVSPWRPPVPIGYLQSIVSAGAFAAPLLAAGSFAMISILLSGNDPQHAFARWGNMALALFVVAGYSQIAAIQCAITVQTYMATPSDLQAWFPKEMQEQGPTEFLVTMQLRHFGAAAKWAAATRFSYHLGILALLAAITVSLVPPGHISAGRILAIAAALVGALGEAVWVIQAVATSRPSNGNT